MLIRYCFRILSLLFWERRYLASIDFETLTSEKHISDKCLQAEPCYIQVKIKGKAGDTLLPMGALSILMALQVILI